MTRLCTRIALLAAAGAFFYVGTGQHALAFPVTVTPDSVNNIVVILCKPGSPNCASEGSKKLPQWCGGPNKPCHIDVPVTGNGPEGVTGGECQNRKGTCGIETNIRPRFERKTKP